jgi:hypothetical protein
MTSRSLLNLTLLAAVASLAAWVYFKPKPQNDSQEYRVSSQVAENVQGLRIERQGVEIVLQKIGENWDLLEPIQGRADEIKVGQILEVLRATSPRRFPAIDLERFDLLHPAVRLYIDKDLFSFGGFVPITNEQYVANNGSIHLLAPRYATMLARQPIDLLSPRLFAQGEIPIGFEFEKVKVMERDGSWRIAPEKPKASLTQNELIHWVQSWQQAYAAGLSLSTERPNQISDGKQGIKITLRGGGGMQLTILQQQPELVLLRVDTGVRYRFPGEMGRRLLDPYTAAGG